MAVRRRPCPAPRIEGDRNRKALMRLRGGPPGAAPVAGGTRDAINEGSVGSGRRATGRHEAPVTRRIHRSAGGVEHEGPDAGSTAGHLTSRDGSDAQAVLE